MTRGEYRRTVKSGGMYTTRDVYGNPRFIIHFLDLVHEDHPGDHCDKWVLDNLKTFKELIDLNNELNDETDE